MILHSSALLYVVFCTQFCCTQLSCTLLYFECALLCLAVCVAAVLCCALLRLCCCALLCFCSFALLCVLFCNICIRLLCFAVPVSPGPSSCRGPSSCKYPAPHAAASPPRPPRTRPSRWQHQHTGWWRNQRGRHQSTQQRDTPRPASASAAASGHGATQRCV